MQRKSSNEVHALNLGRAVIFWFIFKLFFGLFLISFSRMFT